MSKKRKNRSLRITIAITIISIGVGFKIHTINNIHFFTIASAIGILSLIIGLLIIFEPSFNALNKEKPVSFLLYPKRWIINLLNSLLLMAVLVAITLLLNSISNKLSLNWLKYRVDVNSEIALSKVIGFEKKIEIRKFVKSYQKFVKVKFKNGKSIREEYIIIADNSNLRIGDEIEVRYRKDKPELIYFAN